MSSRYRLTGVRYLDILCRYLDNDCGYHQKNGQTLNEFNRIASSGVTFNLFFQSYNFLTIFSYTFIFEEFS